MAWLVLIGTGYMLMFWSLGERPLRQALVLSGSWIYTLGFEVPANLPTTVLAFSEAGFGLVLLAMLIGYLPRSTCGPTPHRPRPPWCSSARRTGSTRG